MDSIFTIDGVGYPGVGVESLTRSALIKDGQNAGELMSGEYERDLVGTYYHYTLVLSGMEPGSPDYDAMYEVLTAPVNSHQVVMPYGQGTLSFQAYIQNAGDTLIAMTDTENWWGNLTIQFMAKKPQRVPD